MQFAKGDFSLENPVRTLTINLDTAARDSFSTRAAPSWHLNQSIQKVFDISVLQATIPNLWFVINTTNNTFTNTQTSTGANTITLTPGTYTASSFTTMLQTALGAPGGGVTYTASISNTTAQLTITVSAGDFTISGMVNTLQHVFGVRTSSFSSTSSTWVSPYGVQLAGFQIMYLQTVNFPTPGLAAGLQNILMPIQVSESFGGTILYINQSQQSVNFYVQKYNSSPQNMSTISLNLLDQYGNLLDPGDEWQLSLQFCYVPN
jgi:hypothetical protein